MGCQYSPQLMANCFCDVASQYSPQLKEISKNLKSAKTMPFQTSTNFKEKKNSSKKQSNCFNNN